MLSRTLAEMLFLFVVALFCTREADAGINNDICMPGFPLPLLKTFPKIPKKFTAAYSLQPLEAERKLLIEETGSEENGNGVIKIKNLKSGVQSKLYSYNFTKEVIYIPDLTKMYHSERNCIVNQRKQGDLMFPFKYVQGHESLISGADLLMLGAHAAVRKYKGTNSENLDMWNACLHDYTLGLTINATFYFTLSTTPSGVAPTIKRIHVRQDNSQETSPSETIYEYSHFSDQISEEKIEEFKLPLGAYCEGRTYSKEIPTTTNNFNFNVEIIDYKKKSIHYTRRWYDFNANMTRMDHTIGPKMKPIPMKMIHDFKTGVQYYINKDTEECEITAIFGESYDASYVDERLVQMKTPKEFLYMYDDSKYPYIYEGQHVVRGVECDVWISKRPYPTEDSPVMAYMEWYFTGTGWTLTTGDLWEDKELFKLVVVFPEIDNQRTDMNIYEFNEGAPNYEVFDISECFKHHNERRSYRFTVAADINKHNLTKNVKVLKYWILLALEENAGIRPARIYNLELEFDAKNNKIYVDFTMLGTPNVMVSVPKPWNQITLQEAELNLANIINKGEFEVYYILQLSGQTMQFPVSDFTVIG